MKPRTHAFPRDEATRCAAAHENPMANQRRLGSASGPSGHLLAQGEKARVTQDCELFSREAR